MKKLVIIGSGMSGGKLIEELLGRENAEYSITVIGDEPYGNYDRIHLADVIKDEIEDSFWINSDSWYKDHGINAVLGDKAVSVDREAKKVVTGSGKEVSYDVLVFATGSHPLIPSIDGADREGVFTLRTISEAEAIKKRLENGSRVLVIGGGLLGLELASTLYDLGKEVTLSHLMNNLMETQLHEDAAFYLEKLLKARGIQFVMGTYLTNLTPQADGSILADFKDGTMKNTDAVIINCGILPNKDLAQACGLATNKGIMVNEKLQTADDAVFALGECIEYEGQTFGLIAPVYEQARALAAILSGEDSVYANSPLPPAKLKGDVAAIAMGKAKESEGDEVIEYKNPGANIFKKLIVRDNLLKGAHLVGEDLNSDALGVYYTSQLPLPGRIEQLLFPGVHKPGSSSLAVYWPDSITICDCNGIDCGTVRQAVAEFGDNLEKVVKASRAGTSCGTCRNRIQSIIDNTYDVIVVGAGLGGLTTAATLAQKGKRVLVIEKHDKVGGYATKFTREDYTFDVSLHNLGPLKGVIKHIFDELGLMERVEYIPYDTFQRVIFPEHNINIPKGIDNYINILKEDFPAEKEGLDKLFNEIKHMREGLDKFDEMALTGDPEVMNNPMMAVEYPQFVNLVETTFAEFLDEYIKDEKLKGIIGNFWWYLGLPPSQAASLIYCVTSINYFGNAGGYIKGTSQELSNALADVIKGHHGRVVLNTEVKKILMADKKARGVLTDEGEIFYADTVISNINAADTFVNLIDESQMKKRIRRKVSNLEYSSSAVQLYLGLDCDPAGLGFKDHSFTIFNSYEHDKNYEYSLNGDYANTFFSCTNYTKVDPESTPEGKGIISIYSIDHMRNWENLSEHEYRKKKEKVTEILLDKVEKHFPGLREHIVVKELGTPKTMHRYTFSPEGSIYGPSHIVDQSGMRRLPTYTANPGLYIVGSTIYPGGGYPSVIFSGYKTAQMILFHDRKKEGESGA